MGFPQCRHFPRRTIHETSGTLSRDRIGVSHWGQCEGGRTTDSLRVPARSPRSGTSRWRDRAPLTSRRPHRPWTTDLGTAPPGRAERAESPPARSTAPGRAGLCLERRPARRGAGPVRRRPSRPSRRRSPARCRSWPGRACSRGGGRSTCPTWRPRRGRPCRCSCRGRPRCRSRPRCPSPSPSRPCWRRRPGSALRRQSRHHGGGDGVGLVVAEDGRGRRQRVPQVGLGRRVLGPLAGAEEGGDGDADQDGDDHDDDHELDEGEAPLTVLTLAHPAVDCSDHWNSFFPLRINGL